MTSEETDFIQCAVCARNILRGERVTEYVTPEREVVAVCTLCKTRAEQMGWTQRSLVGEIRTDEQPRRRGFDLRGRLRGPRLARRGRGMTADELAREIGIPDREPGPASEAAEDQSDRPRRRAVFDDEWDDHEPVAEPKSEPLDEQVASDFDDEFLEEPVSKHSGEPDAGEQPADQDPDPDSDESAAGEGEAADPDSPVAGAAARRIRGGARRESASAPRRPERRPAEAEAPAASAAVTPPRREPRTPARLMRTAAENFNASAESRKVGGLMRSLGEPHVSIRPPAREDLPALVTVAWELSWYQWEVGVELDDNSVREIAKGGEMGELDDAARRWNARADEGGGLRLRRAEAAEGGA